ncbi:hypothetical protein EAH79_08975 [Sphingomonas koreensis]|nr:hypothetical protein EAH79_08975 [Sphingomonas koreensis]
MNSDAALDELAFSVGLRLIGPDERRRLRIALGRDPAQAGHPGFDIEAVERLDDLATGRRIPNTLQDRMDLKRIERERAEPPFSAAFWAMRAADLARSGFSAEAARLIIAEVRKRVETGTTTITEGVEHVGQSEAA